MLKMAIVISFITESNIRSSCKNYQFIKVNCQSALYEVHFLT